MGWRKRGGGTAAYHVAGSLHCHKLEPIYIILGNITCNLHVNTNVNKITSIIVNIIIKVELGAVTLLIPGHPPSRASKLPPLQTQVQTSIAAKDQSHNHTIHSLMPLPYLRHGDWTSH